jgi:hypothetical protein
MALRSLKQWIGRRGAGHLLELKLVVVAVGVCILLLSLQALVSTSDSRSLAGDLLLGFTLILGVVVIFSAPVVSGLITYMRSGTFQFSWWW